MPVKLPTNMRNVTAGSLRELKENGYTTGSGGLWSVDRLGKDLRPELYFYRTEPAGVFMQSLETTKLQLDDSTEAILASGRKLVETAKTANKQMADVTGKFRDGTDKLASAIDKLMKVAGRGDFAETVRHTITLVDSLERLAVLEEKGLLDKVMRAMRG
jgi:hypothetical protein